MRNESGETVTIKYQQVKKKRNLRNRTNSVPGYMRLHKKIFIIFSTITIVMLSIVYMITDTMFLDSFEAIEEKVTKNQVRQATNALVQDIFQLKALNQDYAGWDTTYAFIKDKDPNYIEENLLDETFATNGWNVFILVDTSGEIMYKKGFDLVNNKEVPVSPSLLKQLNLSSPLFHLGKPKHSIIGISSLPEGYMMVSSHPVVTSQYNGAIRGWLVLGRYIDFIKMSQLSEQTRFPIHMEQFTDRKIPENREHIRLSSTNKAVIWAENKDNDYISGYSLIHDIYQNPAFILRVDRSRSIYRQVDSSIKYFMAIILLIGCVYFIATWFFMNKFIFNRLQALMASVNEIGKNKDLSTRVCILLKDEFSTLESEFNIMLDALQESQNRIIHQSQHDDLTNLPNRAYFYSQAKQLLVQAKHKNEMAAVLFFDIDKFKGINDSFGHEIGDHVLQAVTERLKDNISSSNIISRIGGDEFIIFLSNIKGMEDVEDMTQRIIQSIREPFFISDKQIFVTSSIGISLYPYHGTDVETLINNADIAMYRVKKEMKNSFKFYTSDMRNRVSIDMLRSAMENNELQLYYQPKVNLAIGAIEGMETLLRWQNPQYGMISPMEFIPLAEETGLIIPMGEWILQRACMQNKKWQDAGYLFMRVAVNISSIQFMQPDFIPMIKQILEETKLEGTYLELEITESVALTKEEEVIDKLLILKDMGIHISIDDFGTGYSSLSYLERLPVDSLKIDREFIKNIGNDSTIVKMIIGMAQSLELSVVAEGVETSSQLDYLMKFGCKSMQGYLFSKPLAAEKFEELLSEEKKWL